MKKKSCFWAMMCHLSTFLGFLIPGLSLIAPIVIWAAKRERDDLVCQNGRNVINFVLSFWLYTLGIGAVILSSLILVWFPVIIMFERVSQISQLSPAIPSFYIFFCVVYGVIYGVFHLILPIYGAVKALNGEVYRYPLTLTLLKEKDPYPQGKITSTK